MNLIGEKMKQDVNCYVDIDGTLTNETEGWDFENRTPNTEAIEALQQIKREGKNIILYTSRGYVPKCEGNMKEYHGDIKKTEEWLKQYNVPYNELKMAKPDYHSHFDDKSFTQLRKKVLCFSGGVDSLVASYYLGNPELIYFDLQTPYTKNEIKANKKLTEIDSKFEDIVIDKSLSVKNSELKNIGKTKTDIIPYRNLMLLSLASKYGSDLYLIGISGDKSRDKNPDTFMQMEHTLNFLKEEKNRQITVDSPFWDMTKGQIIKWFLLNNKNAEELLQTSISCFESKSIDKGCGICNACLRKYYGLVWAYNEINQSFNFEDYFLIDPSTTDTFKYYIKNIDKYSNNRYFEMKQVHNILGV